VLDGERGNAAIVERAFAHHPVDAERELAIDLFSRQFGRRAVAPPLVREQSVRVADRALATLDR